MGGPWGGNWGTGLLGRLGMATWGVGSRNRSCASEFWSAWCGCGGFRRGDFSRGSLRCGRDWLSWLVIVCGLERNWGGHPTLYRRVRKREDAHGGCRGDHVVAVLVGWRRVGCDGFVMSLPAMDYSGSRGSSVKDFEGPDSNHSKCEMASRSLNLESGGFEVYESYICGLLWGLYLAPKSIGLLEQEWECRDVVVCLFSGALLIWLVVRTRSLLVLLRGTMTGFVTGASGLSLEVGEKRQTMCCGNGQFVFVMQEMEELVWWRFRDIFQYVRVMPKRTDGTHLRWLSVGLGFFLDVDGLRDGNLVVSVCGGNVLFCRGLWGRGSGWGLYGTDFGFVLVRRFVLGWEDGTLMSLSWCPLSWVRRIREVFVLVHGLLDGVWVYFDFGVRSLQVWSTGEPVEAQKMMEVGTLKVEGGGAGVNVFVEPLCRIVDVHLVGIRLLGTGVGVAIPKLCCLLAVNLWFYVKHLCSILVEEEE
ncbi:hypothetical protein Acr_19g0001420 [Actinidia rufa]|uniref:Uncharacterized protein n=1 Tax=Actinidia rufa TaxID=165716 RepID=A0A7J0G8S5_9ERIC|nr:hypothetical protein Acr_19g0001420 [Actinidia rufa]